MLLGVARIKTADGFSATTQQRTPPPSLHLIWNAQILRMSPTIRWSPEKNQIQPPKLGSAYSEVVSFHNMLKEKNLRST